MSHATTPRQSQAERTRARKDQVIQAAIRYFGQDGYHGARLADIAKAAGITEPGLLHHYPSKVQLLMDVLAERDRVDHDRFDPSMHGDAAGLLPSLQNLVAYNQTVPGLVQLFSVLVAESIDKTHPAHSFFQDRYKNLRQQSLEAVRKAQSQGEVRGDIPAEDLVVMIYAMMDGLQVQWLYDPKSIRMDQVFDQFMKLLKPVG